MSGDDDTTTTRQDHQETQKQNGESAPQPIVLSCEQQITSEQDKSHMSQHNHNDVIVKMETTTELPELQKEPEQQQLHLQLQKSVEQDKTNNHNCSVMVKMETTVEPELQKHSEEHQLEQQQKEEDCDDDDKDLDDPMMLDETSSVATSSTSSVTVSSDLDTSEVGEGGGEGQGEEVKEQEGEDVQDGGIVYRDFLQTSYAEIKKMVDLPNSKRKGPRGGVVVPFPEKLYAMLEHIHSNSSSSSSSHQHDQQKQQQQKCELREIVSWQVHGRSFFIHQPSEFVQEILPSYFRQSKITSFQRQMNLYGFLRMTSGRDRGGYYHELFLRGRPDLCKLLLRSKSSPNAAGRPGSAAANQLQQSMGVASEPNLWSYPFTPEEMTKTTGTSLSSLTSFSHLPDAVSSSSSGTNSNLCPSSNAMMHGGEEYDPLHFHQQNWSCEEEASFGGDHNRPEVVSSSSSSPLTKHHYPHWVSHTLQQESYAVPPAAAAQMKQHVNSNFSSYHGAPSSGGIHYPSRNISNNIAFGTASSSGIRKFVPGPLPPPPRTVRYTEWLALSSARRGNQTNTTTGEQKVLLQPPQNKSQHSLQPLRTSTTTPTPTTADVAQQQQHWITPSPSLSSWPPSHATGVAPPSPPLPLPCFSSSVPLSSCHVLSPCYSTPVVSSSSPSLMPANKKTRCLSELTDDGSEDEEFYRAWNQGQNTIDHCQIKAESSAVAAVSNTTNTAAMAHTITTMTTTTTTELDAINCDSVPVSGGYNEDGKTYDDHLNSSTPSLIAMSSCSSPTPNTTTEVSTYQQKMEIEEIISNSSTMNHHHHHHTVSSGDCTTKSHGSDSTNSNEQLDVHHHHQQHTMAAGGSTDLYPKLFQSNGDDALDYLVGNYEDIFYGLLDTNINMTMTATTTDTKALSPTAAITTPWDNERTDFDASVVSEKQDQNVNSQAPPQEAI